MFEQAPWLIDELKTCRRLGISLKRFHGWEPTGGDRVEWDQGEREWMLALDMYERTKICPICGNTRDFCGDEQKVRKAFQGGELSVCFVRDMQVSTMRDQYDKLPANARIPYEREAVMPVLIPRKR